MFWVEKKTYKIVFPVRVYFSIFIFIEGLKLFIINKICNVYLVNILVAIFYLNF